MTGEPQAGMKTAPPPGASGMSASPQRTGALVRAALPLLQSLRVMLNELLDGDKMLNRGDTGAPRYSAPHA